MKKYLPMWALLLLAFFFQIPGAFGQAECPVPVVTVTGPDTVCAFQEGVIFTANTSQTTPMHTFTWEVPEGWTIISGEGESSIEVNIGTLSGAVSVTVTNACSPDAGTTASYEPAFSEDCGEIEPQPVELIYFEGEATKSGVLLAWATATEINNDRFEIERSADGTGFIKIGEVKGHGTTTVRRTYSLRDARAPEGTHYYRLKQIDLDGQFEYSQLIAVDYRRDPTFAKIVIAPNPVNGQFSIALGTAATQQLQIFDLHGKLLYHQALSPEVRELSFHTASLGMRSGLYLIALRSAAGVFYTRLLVQ